MNVLLFLLFGMLDMGLALLNYNSLAEGSRMLARAAIVRGEMAPPKLPEWGPASYSGTVGDGSQYAQIIEPILVAIDPEEVAMQLEWLDGSNELDQRVRVTLSFEHRPMIPVFFGNGFTLTAASTMRIAH